MQQDTTFKQLSDYLESLAFPNNLLSGNPALLPEKNRSSFEQYLDESAELHSMHPYLCAKEDIEAQKQRVVCAKEDFLSQLESDLKQAGVQTGYLSRETVSHTDIVSENSADMWYGRRKGNLNNWEKLYEKPNGIEHDYQQTNTQSIMAKKKASEPKEEAPKEVKAEAIANKAEKAEKRAPQMVTVNGDRVTHGHVFKSNASDDWFFTARLNDVPLRPQKVSKEDMDGVINKTKKIEELMQTYYPTKLMPKVSADDMKLPVSIMTPEGEKKIYKFNAYKEHDPMNVDYGKYRFYAQVDGLKMSTSATKADLNAYFDKVMKPVEMVTKLFGDRLNMAEHYRMFRLPEGSAIDPKQIHIMKNQQSNRYEISVNMGQLGKTPTKELAYDDRQSYFLHKTATKEQLAAKYLGDEISAALKASPKKEVSRQMSLGI